MARNNVFSAYKMIVVAANNNNFVKVTAFELWKLYLLVARPKQVARSK